MATGKLIVIVEDDDQVAGVLRAQFEREGYRCELASDGERGLTLVRGHKPDLVLMDRVLPGMNGDEVTRRLKSDPRTQTIPIIMLTGKGDESDELVGFALGADDYVSKPFSAKRLLARVAARLRQTEIVEQGSDELPEAPILLDRSQPRVFIGQTAVALSPTEWRILAALMAAAGHVLRKEQLLSMIYGKDVPATTADVADEVSSLRRKMGAASACIQSPAPDQYAFCPPRVPLPGA